MDSDINNMEREDSAFMKYIKQQALYDDNKSIKGKKSKMLANQSKSIRFKWLIFLIHWPYVERGFGVLGF